MMKKNFLKQTLTLILISIGFSSFAQNLKGRVTEASSNTGLPAATVAVVGKTIGTSTDANGDYSLKLNNGTYQIRISSIGYSPITKTITMTGGDITLNAALATDAVTLDAVVIAVGSRNSKRTMTDTPLPVDIVSPKELASTGQPTFDKALQYIVPSFNTVMTPVNDATSLLDPYEIRNMGPSRTLILINGKRKNSSALTYVQTSPGRGESGADISAIPQDAIKRVEILRDGASAQYGSDAIAGVMNIILKDRYEYGSVSLNSGITSKGDGFMYGFSVNNGANMGNKGFINYTVDLSQQNKANRSGILSATDEAGYWGAPLEQVKTFLSKYPDGGNKNSTAEIAAAKFLINGGVTLSEKTEVYFNAAYVNKKANSLANYRTPYWRDAASNPGVALLTPAGQAYEGYNPTFLGDLNDYNATIGFRTEKNGWNADVSFTTGGNKQNYSVTNSINRKEGLASPTYFHPGGFGFSHNVFNVDLAKQIQPTLNFTVGSEFRAESFTIMAGDTASYGGVKGIGYSDSFNGFRSENAGTFTRTNFGVYAGLDWDITKDFLLAGTARNEQYSDFGNAFVWKLSSRYKLMDDKLTLRGSVSTGFRAPSLAQIYEQLTQSSFVGGTIQNGGIFNNVSPQAFQLGIGKLNPEKSTNVTVGLGYSPTKNFNMTLDYYSIQINDRIILSPNLGPGSGAGAAVFNKILATNNLAQVAFFLNGMNTITQGIDLVVSQRNIILGNGKLGFNLAANFTLVNERQGSAATPTVIANAGQSVVNPTVEALMFTSRPKQKIILGLNYKVKSITFNLNNTYFGSTIFRQSDLADGLSNDATDPNGNGHMADLQTKFAPKVVTDLGANIDFGKNTTLFFNINNILNVLPKWNLEALNATGAKVLASADLSHQVWQNLTFDGRYPITTYDGSQFSQLGTSFSAKLQFRF